MMRLGAMPCCFISRVSRRVAALVPRQLWTNLIAHIPALIDGSPQAMLLTRDADDHFVQMPVIRRAWRLAATAPGISWSDLLNPAPDRLVEDEDTTPEQHLLDNP